MYYLELIQRFWDYNTNEPVGSTAIAAYLFLLKTSKDNDRYDFKISDVVVSRELRLSRKTVIKTREKLKKAGLIDFQTPKGHPCYYRILLNNSLQFLVEDKLKVAEQENDDIRKEENDYIILEELLQRELFSEINQPDSNEAFIESQQDHKDISFPSFSEFLDYAQTLDAFDPQLESGIREKYETWINNGWTNNFKRPITNWKSSLKSALPFINNSIDTDGFSAKSIPNIKRPKFP